jgi:thioredoxin reductase (NADPH)
VLKTPKIEVIYNTTVVDLIGDQNSGLTGIVVENVKTKERSELETAALFYAIGHTPNTGIFKGVLDMDENGYLVTKPDSTVTNVEGVFACGDVRDHVYRQAITAAGNGCMAAIEVERYLASKE